MRLVCFFRGHQLSPAGLRYRRGAPSYNVTFEDFRWRGADIALARLGFGFWFCLRCRLALVDETDLPRPNGDEHTELRRHPATDNEAPNEGKR